MLIVVRGRQQEEGGQGVQRREGAPGEGGMEIVTMTMRSPWWGVNGRREEARNYNNKRELLVRGVWKYLTVTRRQWAPCGVPCIAWCYQIYTAIGEYALTHPSWGERLQE